VICAVLGGGHVRWLPSGVPLGESKDFGIVFSSVKVQVDGACTSESDLILDIVMRGVLVVVRDHHELAVIGVSADTREDEMTIVPHFASHGEFRVVHKGRGSPARGNNFVLTLLFRLDRDFHGSKAACSRCDLGGHAVANHPRLALHNNHAARCVDLLPVLGVSGTLHEQRLHMCDALFETAVEVLFKSRFLSS